jgi:hypothetical protein
MEEKITRNDPQLSTYKGNAVLTLNPQGRASIAFGLGKAMVIRENLSAILAFLATDGKSIAAPFEMQKVCEEFVTRVTELVKK